MVMIILLQIRIDVKSCISSDEDDVDETTRKEDDNDEPTVVMKSGNVWVNISVMKEGGNDQNNISAKENSQNVQYRIKVKKKIYDKTGYYTFCKKAVSISMFS